MKIYLRAPKDWQAADRHRILGEKVLREDRRLPKEIGVIRFDRNGKRIEIPSQHEHTMRYTL